MVAEDQIPGRPDRPHLLRRAATLGASLVLVVGTLAGAAGTAQATGDWIVLSAGPTELWSDTNVWINATPGTHDQQRCVKWWDGTAAWPVMTYASGVADGWLNAPITQQTVGTGPGDHHFELRCYQDETITYDTHPAYDAPYDSGVDILIHGHVPWGSQLSATATDAWAGTAITINATTPVDTDELCAVFQDGTDRLRDGSWAELSTAGLWNTQGVLADFSLAAPATGTRTYDIRCYPVTATAADTWHPTFTDTYSSGVTITAHGPSWAELSASPSDVWPGDSVTLGSTTPSDTDELCAMFLNGTFMSAFPWAGIQEQGMWNSTMPAADFGIIPDAGTYIFDIRCYPTTMSASNGVNPAYDDPYSSGLTVTGHAASGSGATGDTFQPASSAPSVVIASIPESPFQPAYTNSSYGRGLDQTSTADSGTDYEIAVSVAEPNGAADVTTVQLCLFQDGHEDQCAATWGSGPDPRYAMVITWTRPVDETAPSTGGTTGFAVIGDNNYRLDGSAQAQHASWSDEDAFHTSVHFWFDVSDAMHAGTDWTARVIATNSSGQSNSGTNSGASTDRVLTAGVSYFTWITTARTPLDYGTLDADQASVQTGPLGTFIANADSSVFLQAGDFTTSSAAGSATVTLAGGAVGDAVAAGEAGLDCVLGSQWTSTGAVRIGTTPVELASGLFGAGTGEAGDDSLANTCRLTYGGGAEISKVQYATIVWVGVGPSHGTPYAGALPGGSTTYQSLAR